jgi:serine/threonine-protein kinase RsbW
MRSDQAFSQSYPAVPSSVPRARTALAMFAHATGASSEQVDAVRLAVSEALTNAVMHAYRAQSGAVHVSASRTGGELWVLIADDGQDVEADYQSPGLGMGLALIAHMADYFAMSKRSEGGTEIRMRFSSSPRRSSRDIHLVAA